jgi:hypothetical protein
MKKTLFAFALPLAAGCVMSPPPLAMPLEGARRAPAGSTTGLAYGGPNLFDDFEGGGDSLRFGDGGVRVSHQLTEDLAVGGDLGAAFTIPQEGDGDIFYNARLQARYNPGTDKLAFHAGAGLISNLEEFFEFATLDVGVRGAIYSRDRSVEAYFGGLAALGAPLKDDLGRPTIYGGASAGLKKNLDERLSFGADLSGVVGDSDQTNAFFFSSLTLSVAYTFGAPGRPAVARR